MKKNFQDLMLGVRNRQIFLADIVICLLTPSVALLLRIESLEVMDIYTSSLAAFTVAAVVCKLAAFYLFGLYRHEWRYAGIEELCLIAKGTSAAWALVLLVFFLVLKPAEIISPAFPRSIPVTDGLLTAVMVGVVRFGVRFAFHLSISTTGSDNHSRVLVAGAGIAGSMIVREMRTNAHLRLEPVGFVDDDVEKHGEHIHGIRVLGPLNTIPEMVKRFSVDSVIIAMPIASGKVIRSIVQSCKDANVPSKTVPGIFEILSGKAKVSQIRDVQIEDLLRRGVVKNNTDGIASLIYGRRVMVTGAGGSIGSELCRQIFAFHPAQLIMVGHGENSIFHVATELNEHGSERNGRPKALSVIADLRDRKRMEHIYRACRPEIIFHAAAHKHVGLMEANLPDAVTNNILGTQILVDLADQFGVERFTLISSDKAVNPTCVMGATKRVAELVVHDAAVSTQRVFVTVRFGNVLGSRGSVVPIFKQQIALGGPIRITHPDVKRYFMTIPEAVQLVLHAAYIGKGGEVFVLDMGEPLKIVDLARDLIRLSGLEEGKDIDIEFTGLTQGEKLFEELFFASEKCQRSSHEKILVCRNGMSNSTRAVADGWRDSLARDDDNGNGSVWTSRCQIDSLIRASREEDHQEAMRLLREIVPEYHPNRICASQFPHTVNSADMIVAEHP